ncbi:MAG: hypothetical protein IKF90_06215 [Parasporobacterium sp.]|nr:hypothetical protein [Parasporobacterium sp.]
MTFTNAYKGTKKLFVAGILSLAGSVCVLLSIVPGILGISAVFSGSIGGFFTGGFAALLLLLAGLLLPVIAYILKMVGLAQARYDEPEFYQGFLFATLALIFIVLDIVFSALNIGNAVTQGIIQTVYGTLDVVVAVYVISGIRNLARKLEDYKMAQNGSTLARYITIFYAAGLFATLISVLFGSDLIMELLAGILSFIISILNLVVYIIFLVYLGKAKKMLKNGKAGPSLEKMLHAEPETEKELVPEN